MIDDALLATKLHQPPLRHNFVPRPRLMAKLDRVPAHKFTLITAPAGFGKTTLIREWIERCPHPVGWLSLDEQDNSPARFLRYLVQTFRQANPAVGATSLALLDSSHLPQFLVVLTHLTNDLATQAKAQVIVLDDYHLIHDQAIHEMLDFFITHLPANTHLVIASRSQPPLNLSRWRGQAQLLELTAAELRFTAAETETFLKRTMQLDLSPSDRIALEMRTEGWVAGLQLAGLSVQASDDKSAFINAFTGANRYLADYLFEEVLQHLPAEVRHFLLFTSVTDRLCGGLGDALLDAQASGSQAMVERLDQLQLFITPLDQSRQWYRYHSLFAELLRHHLTQSAPEQIPLLHRRASRWFEQQGSYEEAIRHGLKAQDFGRAADLIEMAFQQQDWLQGDMQRLLAWFEALPDTVTQARPGLILAYAWLLLEILADPWVRIEGHLRRVETLLAEPSFSAEEVPALLAQIDLLRANHARQRGDPERVIELCQRALERLPAEAAYLRSGIIAHLAAGYESLGELAQAGQLFTESMGLCREANNIDGLLFAAARLIDVYCLSGQLRQATSVFEQVQTYAGQRTGPDMGQVFINIGEVYREQNQLELARACLEQGLELCRPFAAWQVGVRAGLMSLARLLMAEGQPETALTTLLEVEALQPLSLLEQSRLAAVRARLKLSQADFDAAAHWARRSGLAVMAEVEPSREFEYLTFVRVLMAAARLKAGGIRLLNLTTDPLQDALDLLARLHDAALAGSRVGQVIECRLLQAQALALQQQMADALDRLQAALDLAEPAGYIRLFADEGQPLQQLLALVVTKPGAAVSTDYIETILAAFPQTAAQASGPVGLPPGNALTGRELTTLRLLATELTIDEIAAELTVSASTVRTYAKRIYNKLDVHSRAEAIYRARALKLL